MLELCAKFAKFAKFYALIGNMIQNGDQIAVNFPPALKKVTMMSITYRLMLKNDDIHIKYNLLK